MHLTRRLFLQAVAATPAVVLLGHVHSWAPDPRFYGYSCACGAEKAA